MSEGVSVEVCSAKDLVVEERKRIDAWLCQIFDPDDYEAWSEPDWHVLVRVGGEWVTHVDIVERVGAVACRPVRLGGIGGVTTLPEWRSRGFASAALENAAAFMRDELRVEFGLLVCDDAMVPFYRRLGWEVVEGPLTFDQPGGKVTYPDVTMVLPCGESEWPEGTIDLCGLPW
jgi:aminoglycoside 2'-N-acetyltransferase I